MRFLFFFTVQLFALPRASVLTVPSNTSLSLARSLARSLRTFPLSLSFSLSHTHSLSLSLSLSLFLSLSLSLSEVCMFTSVRVRGAPREAWLGGSVSRGRESHARRVAWRQAAPARPIETCGHAVREIIGHVSILTALSPDSLEPLAHALLQQHSKKPESIGGVIWKCC